MSEAAETPSPKVAPRKRRGVGGAMLAAAMVGLQEALEGPKEEPAVVEVGNGERDPDEPVAMDLDPVDPSASVAVVRPWLLRD
ncbi:MAG TPA: hypothetical protein VM933_08640 [Acidimicrobiales bacterium]|nr:hypothetical protein [Acidimicrobiales bacterium]